MSAQTYITCRELIGFIAEYLDGTLDRKSAHEFERHLRVCPSCVAYLESYRRTVRLGREALRASDDPASGAVPEGLISAIRAARRARG